MAPRLTTDTYRALYLRDTFWVYKAFDKGTAILCTGGGLEAGMAGQSRGSHSLARVTVPLTEVRG